MLEKYCTPTIIYIVFTLTHIIIDTLKGLYNVAFIKALMMISFSFILNFLCSKGLTVISWLIVFIPFITMTIISTIALYIISASKLTKDNSYMIEHPNK